ncbi:unnamed protein product [Paramecium sonneborni]|uniref:Transmembrane protein n=1 Tax=Paramecium sonneborni TaxID=65129 RepID=A0A8S1KJ56_9CILI|nr:unnamed protein product [Paramecium sonneborni]
MIYLIITFSILLYTTAINLVQDKKCTCNQIVNQQACQLNQNCLWNNTSCQNKSCSEIYYKSQCINNLGCFFNNSANSCQKLTNCNQINTTSTSDCASQSKYCGLYNTTSKECYSLTITACSSYTVQQECLYSNQDQLCYWTNSQCQDFNCQFLGNQSQCNLYSIYCTWDFNNTQCIAATCDNKPTSECTFVLQKQSSQNQTTLQPCFIDQSKKPALCRDATVSDLSPFECTLNTFNYATWNDESLETGSCQYCYAYLINILSLALLIMIQ